MITHKAKYVYFICDVTATHHDKNTSQQRPLFVLLDRANHNFIQGNELTRL